MTQTLIRNTCTATLLLIIAAIPLPAGNDAADGNPGWMPFEETTLRHPPPHEAAPSGDGFYSSRYLLFEGNFGDDPNITSDDNPLGSFVSVGEAPWEAILLGAFLFGCWRWWRGKP
jgi:hypothetical protein